MRRRSRRPNATAASSATAATAKKAFSKDSSAYVLWFAPVSEAISASATALASSVRVSRRDRECEAVCSASEAVLVVWMSGTGREVDPFSNRSTAVTFTLPYLPNRRSGRATSRGYCRTSISMLGEVNDALCSAISAELENDAQTMTVNATSYPAYICIS